jgi:hypothetical protein
MSKEKLLINFKKTPWLDPMGKKEKKIKKY